MRVITILILIFSTTHSYSQQYNASFDPSDAPLKDGKITYIVIDSVQGMPKEKLYSKTLEWIAMKFKDANSAIKMENKEDFKIIVKAASSQSSTFVVVGQPVESKYLQRFTIDFSFKNDKYRMVMTDFICELPNADPFGLELHLKQISTIVPKKKSEQLAQSISSSMLSNAKILKDDLATSLKKHLMTASVQGSSDNW
ncbi:uncharacterized protein with TBP-like fold DUF4468 [Arcticibacter tournemirensis]|uniref:DUF4468 domain-containing protein n=1 Tax=Arcticibacter tournemirensis TaxID=699437 RepID=A0A5M9HA11_9SPHI|nr:DUF4468 domain-containing protein [Arcticibacter tournemirensis]KAA8483773.1 DUF4468 domain-containing protein [Arcticibacter tournemirensis]TQM50025.1 uncharacterized protein with TBP-like fold DUF4468 [Arcticibacter tournemirensis]